MGLFNKLKNALFEEEEIDLEPTPDKVIINDEEPTKKKEPIRKKEISLENERELFKAENTFNFPDFDEEEFVTSYEPVKPKVMEKVEERKNPEPKKIEKQKIDIDYDSNFDSIRETTRKERKSFDIDYDDEPKIKNNYDKEAKRERTTIEKETVKKAFHPSPVISPVYGILDKNYKKEDFIAEEKTKKMKRSTDVDMARKKAFGLLEEDIEETIEEPTHNFYLDDAKSIDDLLKDSIDETIELKNDDVEDIEDNFEEESTPELKKYDNNIEEELDKEDENLENIEEDEEIVEEPKPKKKNKSQKVEEENIVDDNTLESDLFDLIDSMYDNREEE